MSEPIGRHLKTFRQMVFLVGPRQVGKTTLAKSLLSNPADGINYFNWDIAAHRKVLSTQIFTDKVDLSGSERRIIVFDEIHKFPRWKNAIKGLFDKYEPNAHWIITGSAALNVYRKGQDSLMGRSFTYHLCPFSVAEALGITPLKDNSLENLITCEISKPDDKTSKIFELLLKFSGFPEPFLKENETFLRRWRTSRLDRLINQDLAGTESLKNLPLVEHLMFLMPERVGSPLSLNSLREDLEVHFATIKHWVLLLERVFYGFKIHPYGGHSARMLKKETKWYLWDWTEIADESFRFENLIAVHLMKYVYYVNDLGIDHLSLYFVRDKEKREVDFLICRRKKPFLLIECKLRDQTPSKSLIHFARVLKPKRSIQLTADAIDPVTIRDNDIKVDILPAASFLLHLV